MLEENKIHQGDCMELMKHIPDKSVDMILCDLPYGTTACKWDKVLPLDDLWKQYKRLLKEDGVVVLTASQPFTTDLINSNRKWFRYCLVWNKKIAGNIFLADNQPMKIHEDICVFGGSNYFPIMEKRDKPRKYKDKYGGGETFNKNGTGEKEYILTAKYPKSILEVSNTLRKGKLNPTEKPVKLFRYLIKTYSNEGDLILDNCIGSGTTAVACKQTNRRFIGIELSQEYVDIANERLKFTMVSDFYSEESSNRNLTEDFAKSSQINPTD